MGAKSKAKGMPKASRGVVQQRDRRREDVKEIALALDELEQKREEEEKEDKILLEEVRAWNQSFRREIMDSLWDDGEYFIWE